MAQNASYVLFVYIGVVIPNAVVSIWTELFDHFKYDITMQLFCTKLPKKDTFGGKVCRGW